MGSIFKRDNTWRGQVTINGHRKSVSGKTKKEVEKKLAEIQYKYNKGLFIERNDITVKEWCQYWLETKKEPYLKPKTYSTLVKKFENHIYPFIGDQRLQKISRFDLEQMYSDSFSDKDYSTDTIKLLAIQVNHCFEYAVERELLAKNPHHGVELPKKRAPKKISSYTCADQKLIVSTCKEGKEANTRLFYFLISTGMRFGEAVALTWDDVDLNTGQVNITKTAVELKGGVIIQDQPKTKAGVRTIFLSPTVLEWLREHKASLDQSRNKYNLVFPNGCYNVIRQTNARRFWLAVCKESGVEYKSIHSLRHTWATRALESGIDVKIVSSMLGHSNVVTTMNVYQDVMAEQKIKAACTMNALF